MCYKEGSIQVLAREIHQECWVLHLQTVEEEPARTQEVIAIDSSTKQEVRGPTLHTVGHAQFSCRLSRG